MAETMYAARMRYLDAGDVDSAGLDVNFNGLQVQGPDANKIGNVDGFIIDTEARRVTYVVIDSGGWFTSRRLLLPIGHAALSADRRAIQTDVTRDTLRRLPEFDDSRFREFTDDELRAFERNTVVACCPDEPLEEVSVGSWGYDSRRHYQEPDWWKQSRYDSERLRPIDSRIERRPGAATAAAAEPASHDRERVVARDRAQDVATRSVDSVSPHLEGRAQPGDVLGIETAGERTKVGDTAEDEDKRRRDAEESAPDRDRE
jgi:hypothetical protein